MSLSRLFLRVPHRSTFDEWERFIDDPAVVDPAVVPSVGIVTLSPAESVPVVPLEDAETLSEDELLPTLVV
jgi:hypothetical protein